MSFLLPSVKQILEESEGTVQVEPSTVDLIIEAFKTRIPDMSIQIVYRYPTNNRWWLVVFRPSDPRI